MATFSFLKTLKNINLKTEMLAGMTVAMTMIPESLSFAILAGLAPLIGLYAAFLMGLITAIFGGRPGMVSGGAGSTVVVLIALVSAHGPEYLFAAVALAGIFQALVGIFKLGKFVRLIPQPVMYGFLNGLAIIIFMAQVEQFKITTSGITSWLHGTPLLIMAALTLLTILIVVLFPKFSKAVPSSLIAIIITSLLVYFLGIHTKKVIDIAAVSGKFPAFHIPAIPLTWETLQTILPYSLLMAGVGLIETLLTLNMVDEMTETKGNANKEAVAQGAANVVNGFFGGMGGCAMVAQTLVNIEAGARSKLSAFIGAITILMIILIGGSVIEQIPMAALVGVMMMVAISTFKWGSLRIIRKMPKTDIFVGILVAAITVIMQNLALAVLIGVIISALVFAWDNAKRIRARKHLDAEGNKIYEIYGPLFFGSTTAFLEKFDVAQDPQRIIIDFKESRVADMSAIDALKNITEKYTAVGKQAVLRHLSADCRKILKDASGFIEVDIQEDPTYAVMPK
ncbi:SulP family inorganic anion transporter [Arachidicoccus terrestris]|uniref:SulP family inorganic anion transporter n=1 Tax=Arachidicoccus terrestris TaxID=2875539 RepID=UPI001CC82A9C|nr:SulP family inorganic anion transporter [Arachidicoccus terrestris]UAY56158.1 SulP family inorganic anion transporter [Arachidicoccus terrestris]